MPYWALLGGLSKLIMRILGVSDMAYNPLKPEPTYYIPLTRQVEMNSDNRPQRLGFGVIIAVIQVLVTTISVCMRVKILERIVMNGDFLGIKRFEEG